ncbi:molybdopterin cofactor-binding domain-containing protein [Rhizobium sp. L1K21]|uniref:xanthine dehydrogenase family protein molybdopterin-binding subunit n=1 Tax=Rhizobium sp. L1K21 TaxID=2954933 RepID=UPI00209315FD|nr:molybdopterin cofactor-binding domain-containing protein [Rhizobium sp. L1K21]MCO6188111.1 molybdopterin-dependent oxidoreductase [Rhizobium sp. L1K21]
MGRLATITRRTFLVGAAVVAGGAAFGYYKYQQPYANPLEGDLAEGESTFNPYVKIGTDDTITVIAPRAEMGQGVYTTLAALVAEELDVTLDQITIEHGPSSPAYFNEAGFRDGAPFAAFDRGFVADAVRSTLGVASKFLAIQMTGGSSSTIDAYDKMRHAGAVAREMLKAAAAEKLGVPAASLKTEAGQITDPASGKVLTYGEVALDAARRDPPSDVTLRDRSKWKILGRSQPRRDMPAKVTGAPVFGIDVDLPDMLYATVRMNPQPGGGMTRFDDSQAKSMRGVKKVIAIDSPYGKGIAVIADNTWRAFQAAQAVEIEWADGPGPRSSDDVSTLLDETLATDDFFSLRTIGDPDVAFADAPREKIVEAVYDAPFLSHAPLEPMNATARVKDGVLDIWAPNQVPTVMKMVGGRITGFEDAQINVHTTFLGGGFGRRLEPDFSDYAVRIAMETDGRPVKVTWTREEDVSHGPYRPIARGRYRAVMDDNGLPKALVGSVASPSVIAGMVSRIMPGITPAGPDNTLVHGAFDQPYGIPNYRIDGYKLPLKGIEVASWRSVGNSYNGFMHESFIDELAHAGGKDPLSFRRELMKDYPAALAVLDKLEEISGWNTPLPEGKARGMAFTLSFGTWVGEVVQVADVDGSVRIEKVWCVADPGQVIDPKNFEAQMMSGIIFGLSAGINQKITFADGAVEQSNFHDFDAMRMSQCPQIDVAILENSDHMSGAGEPGLPPVMPALANAIFALNGKRVRRMPLNEEIDFV